MQQAAEPTKKVTIRRPAVNVVMVLRDAETGKVLRIVESHNRVVDEGTKYYAQRGANETPTYTFNAGKLALASSYRDTEASGTAQTLNRLVFTSGTSGIRNFDSTYPKTNDSDTDNTGAGVRTITYRRTYTTSEANFLIKALGICRNGATTNPAAASALRKILNYLTFSAAEQITKTSSQTLKVFVNHTFSGPV